MDETTADATDLGNALTALGDSMDHLSTDLTSLQNAVEGLESSTRSLSEQQEHVSRKMDETAASLTARESRSQQVSADATGGFSAAADD